MKKRTSYGLALTVMLVALVGAALLGTRQITGAHAASCTSNADGHGDSAVVVNPTGTFSGTLDATGCDFGVYVGPGHSANIKGADIFGATFSNIAVDGSANITNSQLTQSEMGVEVGVNQSAHAVITGNTIGYIDDGCGIEAFISGTTLVIDGNHITGPSATFSEPIAIDIGEVASAILSNNTLTTNVIGIFVEESPAAAYRISGNTLQNNGTGIETDSTTNAQVVNNILNTGQTGIIDDGTGDTIQGNFICHYTIPIDTSGATNPNVSGNHTNC